MKKYFNRLFYLYPRLSICIVGISFILLHAVFTFCSKKKCPPFSNKYFDNWFPYHAGELIRFKNSTGSDNTITFQQIFKSQGYESGGYNSRACMAGCEITSSPDNNN